MRIKINFRLPSGKNILPINYQYPLSAWIYKVLGTSDNRFAEFLHNAGYRLENNKTFKLFTFSNLQFPPHGFRVLKGTDRMELRCTGCSLTVAFLLPDTLQHFVAGLFASQQASIGDKISGVTLEVTGVEMFPQPHISPRMHIRAISPVVVARDDEPEKQEQYLRPADNRYTGLFFKNLTDKHHAWQRQTNRELTGFSTDELHFRCLTENPKSRLQTIKAFTREEVKVRGYLFDFEISAPPELIQTGLNAGFGSMNAVGFGCGEVVDGNINKMR